MENSSIEKPDYGNWVSKRLIFGPAIISIVFFGLSFLSLGFLVVAVPMVLICLYFTYARHLFSAQGGNVQDQFRSQVLKNLDWEGNGQVLDIGCGSGSLTIEAAKKYPQAQVLGIDYWGTQWEYSKNVCEQNAALEGVAERVRFEKASASALPFDDESMDVVISNFVFHEVGSVKDKKELLREALRVLKKDGKFVLQDLFLWKQVYGDTDQLLETLRSWGIKQVTLINTSEMPFNPGLLKLPFMTGTAAVLVGQK